MEEPEWIRKVDDNEDVNYAAMSVKKYLLHAEKRLTSMTNKNLMYRVGAPKHGNLRVENELPDHCKGIKVRSLTSPRKYRGSSENIVK
jgi:hypothetical protein